MIKRSVHIGYALVPVLAAAWLVGAVLRDRWLFTAWLFYIPAAVVVAAGAAWLALFARRPWQWTHWLVAALTVTAALKVLAVDFSWRRIHARANTVRLVNWNIENGCAGPEQLLDVLAGDKADIYLLSEFPDPGMFEDFAGRLLPHPFTRRAAGMLLVSRYPFIEMPAPDLDHARAWAVRIGLNRVEVFDLLAVDFISDPRLSRARRIEKLAAWVRARPSHVPLMIVGDFNTPRDSIHFETLRGVMTHAYEMQGRGRWPYTWPRYLPLYAIDHAWVEGIRVYNYRLRWSRASDHARQVMDLRAVVR